MRYIIITYNGSNPKCFKFEGSEDELLERLDKCPDEIINTVCLDTSSVNYTAEVKDPAGGLFWQQFEAIDTAE